MSSQQRNETASQDAPHPTQQEQQRHQEWYSVYKPESDTAAPDPLDPGKRYHDGIWVKHSPSTNKGSLFHVTGDVIAARGMRYEQRDDWTPGDSGPLHNLTFLGYVRKEEYESGRLGRVLKELPTPPKQQGINFWEKDPVTGRHELIWTQEDGELYGSGEERRKVFKCNEWSAAAVEKLKEVGLLKDEMGLV